MDFDQMYYRVLRKLKSLWFKLRLWKSKSIGITWHPDGNIEFVGFHRLMINVAKSMQKNCPHKTGDWSQLNIEASACVPDGHVFMINAEDRNGSTVSVRDKAPANGSPGEDLPALDAG